MEQSAIPNRILVDISTAQAAHRTYTERYDKSHIIFENERGEILTDEALYATDNGDCVYLVEI